MNSNHVIRSLVGSFIVNGSRAFGSYEENLPPSRLGIFEMVYLTAYLVQNASEKSKPENDINITAAQKIHAALSRGELNLKRAPESDDHSNSELVKSREIARLEDYSDAVSTLESMTLDDGDLYVDRLEFEDWLGRNFSDQTLDNEKQSEKAVRTFAEANFAKIGRPREQEKIALDLQNRFGNSSNTTPPKAYQEELKKEGKSKDEIPSDSTIRRAQGRKK